MGLTLLKVGAFDMPSYLEEELKKRGELFVDSKLDEAQRAEVRAKTDFVIASGISKFTPSDYETTPNLKGIVCFSVGYDQIDVNAAISRNIFFTHTPDVLNDDVANTAMMLLLDCTREAKFAQEHIENRLWVAKKPFPLTTSIGHKKMGIAGLGRIGKEIATRALAFKMEIGYYGRHEQKDVPYRYFANLKDMAAWSDVLMLAMPATADNRHCVKKEILEALGKDGYLINIARGSIVNTEDLVEAIKNHTIAGAGLDVYETEPCAPEGLMGLPNVALQPHAASGTHETRKAMADLVLQNLDAIIAGQKVITPVPGTRTI